MSDEKRQETINMFNKKDIAIEYFNEDVVIFHLEDRTIVR